LKKNFAFLSLFLLFGFVIFNIGFSTIGVFGIPFFQLVSLLTCVLLVLFYPKSFSKFPTTLIYAYLILLLYSGTIFIISLFNGYPFLRVIQDFEMIFDMMFIIIGFFLAGQFGKEGIKKILTILFITCFLSGLIIFIFGEAITNFSPMVGIYRPIPLFGNVVGYFYIVASGAFYFLYVNPMKNFNSILFALLCVTSLFPQKRFSIIIITVFIFNYLLFTKSNKKIQLIGGLFLLFLFISFVSIFNIEGPRGLFNFEFFSTLYSSILLNPETEFSGGIFWRFNVAFDSLSKMENIYHYLFGIGFGQPLSNLVNQSTGLITRQPHIFFLDTLIRLGSFGILIMINFLYLILRNIYLSYEESKISNWFFITILLCIACAQSNPLLQYVHMSFPIYVFVGMAIYLSRK